MNICPKCGGAVPADSKFCAGCGSQVGLAQASNDSEASPVLAQGQPPKTPAPVAPHLSGPPITRFCQGCGTGLVEKAVICPACGTSARRGAGSSPAPKTKSTAVLLAVFLSFWTWIYTYKATTWKFWVGLGVSVVGLRLYFIPSLAIWVWAIVDVSLKPESYFAEYASD